MLTSKMNAAWFTFNEDQCKCPPQRQPEGLLKKASLPLKLFGTEKQAGFENFR